MTILCRPMTDIELHNLTCILKTLEDVDKYVLENDRPFTIEELTYIKI